MILTEEEAKAKWCPFGRCVERAWGAVVVLNDPRGDLGGDKAMCIASQCMAWRWLGAPPEDDGNKDARGFCGIAGHPRLLFYIPASEPTL